MPMATDEVRYWGQSRLPGDRAGLLSLARSGSRAACFSATHISPLISNKYGMLRLSIW